MVLVTANEMREMDRLTIESFGLPGRILMENAGRGAYQILVGQFPDIFRSPGNKIKAAVLAGGGNNGGDGFVIARCLSQKNVDTTVYLLSPREKIKGDAKANLDLLSGLDINVVDMTDNMAFNEYAPALEKTDIIIDAILGTGLNSNVEGCFKDVIDFVNTLETPVFSVDIPSGINSDSGQIQGTCIRADVTATFAFAKIGHIVSPGADYTGALHVVDIGIPGHIAAQVPPRQYLISEEMVSKTLKPRPSDAHKGTTGHLLIIAGSKGKTGAARMVAESALRAGAGLVTLGVPESIHPVMESVLTEPMTISLDETFDGAISEESFEEISRNFINKKCLAIGPGLGQDPEARTVALRLIQKSPVPIVIDADALNSLAGHTEKLKNISVPAILTPHPGEMARLTGLSVSEIQKDRIGCARDFAHFFKVHLVLKGHRTVIAHPDGTIDINPTGNPGMAVGGMGDVLTGLIAGLITQGMPPKDACRTAVFLHGRSADTVSENIGGIGYLATEVCDRFPYEMKRLTGVCKH